MVPLSSVITCLDCLQNVFTISDKFFAEVNCCDFPLMMMFNIPCSLVSNGLRLFAGCVVELHSNLFGLKKQILESAQIFNNVIYSPYFVIK